MIAQTLANVLFAKKISITTAESCTGGLLSAALTEVPGMSRVFYGGFVTYANEAKVRFLHVDEELIKTHGAVSERVAKAMAEGALHVAGAELAIAVTGIAGPSGGTPGKPVGTVFIGLATHDRVEAYRNEFAGTRDEVREKTVTRAVSLAEEWADAF